MRVSAQESYKGGDSGFIYVIMIQTLLRGLILVMSLAFYHIPNPNPKTSLRITD